MSIRETDGNPTEQPRQVRTDGGAGHELTDSVRFGGLLYVILGLGTFVTFFLMGTLGGTDATLPFQFAENEALYSAVFGGYNLLLYLIPVVSLALGYIYHSDNLGGDDALKFSAVAAAVGSALVLVVLLLLMMMFEPDYASVEFGDELPAMLGAVIGAAVVAGVTTFVLDNYRE